MKQTWGLIVADPNEIHNSPLTFLKETKLGQTLFSHYQWTDVEIIVVESGIGIVNASMMTQKLIDIFKVDKILNYGAVGATQKVKLFDVVIPHKFYFHDVETPWYPRGQTPGEKEYYLNSFQEPDKINIASGNSFVHKIDHLKNIVETLDVDLFDMESSAIAQVCSKNKTPFFSVKGVSDIIDITDTKVQDINKNIATSSEKSFIKLINLFDEIKIHD